MSVTATANQPAASSGSITFSWTTSSATSTTASLQYATLAGGPFTTLTSTTLTDSLNGTRNGVYTTPTTSYYYQTTITATGTGGPVTSTSTVLYYYNPYQGPQGVQGYQGVKGDQGTAGPTGIQGATGLQGPGGYSPTGPTGPTFIGGPISKDLYFGGGTASIGQAGAAFNNIFFYGSISNTVDSTTSRIGGVTLGPSGALSCGAITAPTTTNTINSLVISAGTCTGVDFVATSDIRTKTDISTITGALDKVKALRGVYFTRNGETSRNVGVIAQEVEEVVPEVVHTGSDDMKSVSYGNMVGLLIEAIKELSLSNKIT